MKIVAYLRISGKGQLQGTGLDRQRDTITAWAEAKGHKVVKWYEEVYTGTEVERPVFTEMLLDLLNNGVRTIAVESSDRLARDSMVSQQLVGLLIQKGLSLWSASSDFSITEAMAGDPMMRAIAQMQAVFAELEKNMLVSRLKKARDKMKKETGRCTGPLPYGEYEGEQDTFHYIKQMRSINPTHLARILNEKGWPTRNGAKWSAPLLTKIFKRLEAEDAKSGSRKARGRGVLLGPQESQV